MSEYDSFDFMAVVMPTGGGTFPDGLKKMIDFNYAKGQRDYWMKRALDAEGKRNEPRKPREWEIRICGGQFHALVRVGKQEYSDVAETVRVIEWPEGAPLPEWPK